MDQAKKDEMLTELKTELTQLETAVEKQKILIEALEAKAPEGAPAEAPAPAPEQPAA